MAVVYLGLGSNLGDIHSNLKKALTLLQYHPSIKLIKTSSLVETEPVGYTKQANFLNCVVQIKTKLPPQELLQLLLDMEKEMGRVRQIKWGPRIIDLDILFYNKKIIKEKNLIIPHPELHKRKFVLESLVELCPNFRHPILKKTMLELFSALNSPPSKGGAKGRS